MAQRRFYSWVTESILDRNRTELMAGFNVVSTISLFLVVVKLYHLV